MVGGMLNLSGPLLSARVAVDSEHVLRPTLPIICVSDLPPSTMLAGHLFLVAVVFLVMLELFNYIILLTTSTATIFVELWQQQ